MAEETKVETKVETTQPATEQKVEEKVEEVKEIDYDAELIEAQKKAEANKLGYAARKAKEEVEEEVKDESDDIADKVIKKILPVINSATQSNLMEGKLNELSGGNEALKRSIKWHMDNSVNPALDINERVEAAYAIANKKVIAKTLKEINIAQKNRANIVGVGEGTSTEVQQKPGVNVLSEVQLNRLKQIAKANNWDAKTTEKFIQATQQKLSQSK
jgi:hypothetical protein